MNRFSCFRKCDEKSKIQPSTYQTIPQAIHSSACDERILHSKTFFQCNAYTMASDQKNVAIDPGNRIDFATERISENCAVSRIAPGEYRLSRQGIYLTFVQLHLLHGGQVSFSINNEERLDSVFGASGDGIVLHGFYMFRTELPDSILSVCNPAQSAKPIFVAAYSGGILPVTADLFIARLA